VENVFIDCESQMQAFCKANSLNEHRLPPILHPPHGKSGPSGRWHYHARQHDVSESGKLVDYHFNFLDTDENEVRDMDNQIRGVHRKAYAKHARRF
jgi:hypothetical protein